MIFYAEDPELPVLVEHLAQYRRAVFLRQGEIVLSDGQQEHVVVALDAVSLGEGVAAEDRTAVLLASLAAAWALEIPPALMAAGLRRFDREAPIAHEPIRRLTAAVASPEPLAEKSL
ncbi:cyanophycin synthetase [compost metagenome]